MIVTLLAELSAGARNPHRAALSFVRQLERKGLLCSARIDCQQIVVCNEPLCASTDAGYDLDLVTHSLEKRFAGESKPIRIFWLYSDNYSARFDAPYQAGRAFAGSRKIDPNRR